MARQEILQPSAACLSASMRDIGYSLETAVADIIDNSITAEATLVNIISDIVSDSPVFIIIDNGKGMNAAELLSAMRHGSRNPNETRSNNDLGRFGLGLKTASFSQCKNLTVISSQNGVLAGASWDLDLIDKEDKWVINVLDQDEILDFPYIHKLAKTGTLVAWQKLDRLLESTNNDNRDEIINEKITHLEKHLSLVFHRFIAGEFGNKYKLSISINGHNVEAFDPFCTKNKATQKLPEEKLSLGNKIVIVQAYVMPHHSRLSQREQDYYNDRSEFLSNQGAYVYRNGRLMVWGDWFRIVPKAESSKLARVKIDFTSDCDEDWTIDIKKSKATPPALIRNRLKTLIPLITTRSIEVSRGRGKKIYEEVKAPLWERFSSHAGVKYQINSRHPLIESVKSYIRNEDFNKFKILLDSISASLPLEYIYSDYAIQPSKVHTISDESFNAWESLTSIKEAIFLESRFDHSLFSEVVKSTNLFEEHKNIVDEFIKEFS